MERFGPNSAVVEAALDRAARLTEGEAMALWEAHLKEREREALFHAALSAVIDASHVNRRRSQIRMAEQAGRAVVTVYPGTSLGEAIGGCVGRLAEALVVADTLDAASVEPLVRPWLEAVGPLGPLAPGEAARP
jgi:hypothetical protein